MEYLGFPSPSAQGLKTTSIVCGLTGDMDPYLLQRYNVGPDDNFVFKRLAVRSVRQNIHPVQLLHNHSLRKQLEKLVSPDVGVKLISLFFRFVYPHFPILSPAQSAEPERSNPSNLAVIYLVTLPFVGFDDYLSVQIAYDLPDAEELWNLSLNVLHQELHELDLSVLQTLVLLLISPPHKPLMPDYATKWSLVGTTVTVAQTLGLHFNSTFWSIPNAEIELRKRLWWTVKMIVWHAAVLGRSCLIHDDDWLVLPPSLDGFSEEERTTLFPAQFIHIAAADSQSASQDEEISLSDALFLGGHFVKVLLFRAILRPFNALRYRTVPTSSTDEHRELEACRLARAGAKGCIASFVAFTSNLKSSWIYGFWPFWCTLGWSTLCNLALLLHATADSPEEAQECRTLLDQARIAVRLQSKSLDILRFSLLRIHSIFWKGLDSVFIRNGIVGNMSFG
ncbi:hypothetical protein COCSADRAFT_173048 [Bipolaris sorokiniana ND90Pr]|uniref:Xylanolytic transcriptional activator regulatory domain-containing protein n=1 Tax=Cochliobolus sativus (strain ND90Pr / ATCC 201652) TaxID=665912 RepID=M2R635_COCSN|nr:uncharacterized protein COCSADRAFT_173048 [Bipolaris sorokiniana ND90Pr]EMD62609.1 hypothetical protein COCSADRAFT_173048 [Bipolaris sorokiniana ND90Pr]